jgi:hypothetical protein
MIGIGSMSEMEPSSQLKEIILRYYTKRNYSQIIVFVLHGARGLEIGVEKMEIGIMGYLFLYYKNQINN